MKVPRPRLTIGRLMGIVAASGLIFWGWSRLASDPSGYLPMFFLLGMFTLAPIVLLLVGLFFLGMMLGARDGPPR